LNTHTFTKQAEKFKQTSSGRMLMAAVFWDRKGVLMVEFMQQRTTTMSQIYCETLQTLRRAIQSKRCGMHMPGVGLLHDSSRPHTGTAVRARALLEHFNWELFDHPPYSPHFAPRDYHLFTYLKNWLGSQCFNNNEVLVDEGIKTWLS
jgi:hypothetical protein